MTTEKIEVIAKHTTGQNKTHNKDGLYTKCWRLLSDGRVQRTNTKSKYQPMRRGEKPPAEIVEAAKSAGIAIVYPS